MQSESPDGTGYILNSVRSMHLAWIGGVPVHELTDAQRLRRFRRLLRNAQAQFREARREADTAADPLQRASLLRAIGLLEAHIRGLLCAIEGLQPRTSADHDAASVRVEREYR